MCYADDTLVLVRGKTWEALRRVTQGTTLVVRRIRALGLEVALHKTETMAFYPPRRRVPPQSHLSADGVRIEMKLHMKYLGLYLDCH